MVDEGKALGTVRKYFDILTNTGYMKQTMMQKFVIYLFLLDFIDYTHRYMDEEEYDMIDNALRKLFVGGGCLLPYSVCCAEKVTLGRDEYMGVLKNRITEDLLDNEDRYTEDEYIRVI